MVTGAVAVAALRARVVGRFLQPQQHVHLWTTTSEILAEAANGKLSTYENKKIFTLGVRFRAAERKKSHYWLS